MRQGFQFGESQKRGRAFEIVDVAGNAREPLAIGGILFELHKFAIQHVKFLITFHEKLANDFIAHACGTS